MAALNEAADVLAAVKKASLPVAVREVTHHLDVDASGRPAVWIWVVVDDVLASSKNFPSVAAEIRDTIRDALQQAGIDRWPYVRFRTRSEEAELAGDPAR